jgi:cellobiose-specific phosphotransferase system component IIC
MRWPRPDVALLNTDGAWIAIGMSVLFIVVGLVMHHVFVNVLKKSEPEQEQDD